MTNLARRLAVLPLTSQFQALGRLRKLANALPPVYVRCSKCGAMEDAQDAISCGSCGADVSDVAFVVAVRL